MQPDIADKWPPWLIPIQTESTTPEALASWQAEPVFDARILFRQETRGDSVGARRLNEGTPRRSLKYGRYSPARGTVFDKGHA